MIFKDNPISSALDIPLYQQLYTHLRTAILSGDLQPGMRLPSTRALADELSISRNTVLNAYQQLLCLRQGASRQFAWLQLVPAKWRSLVPPPRG